MSDHTELVRRLTTWHNFMCVERPNLGDVIAEARNAIEQQAQQIAALTAERDALLLKLASESATVEELLRDER